MPYDKAKAATNVKLKRMADHGEIRRIQKGVYCHVRQTVFGPVTPDINKAVARELTVKDGTRIGYESGASLFNRLGLSTQLPRTVELTTNRYGMQMPEGCHIKVKRPPAVITDDNWKYLQFIDAVENLSDCHIDADDPDQILRAAAKKQRLDPLALIFTARRYYPSKTVLRLTDLLMEGQYGSAQG